MRCGTWRGKISTNRCRSCSGGNFRTRLLLYLARTRRRLPEQGRVARPAQRLKSDPHGFKAFKVDIHHALGINMQEYTPSIGPMRRGGFIQATPWRATHSATTIASTCTCHCELGRASAIKVAQAVESINPLFFEDPLAPEWSASWIGAAGATRIPS